MKIKDDVKWKLFYELEIGDVFALGGIYYIKISSDKAFNLKDNRIAEGFHDDFQGLLLDAEIVIRS